MNRTELSIVAILALSLGCYAQDAAAPAKAVPLPQPSAASSGAPPQSSTVVSAATYIIGASDVLTVTVWKDATLSGQLLVRPDGMISMPLLGDIHAAGLTPLQLGSDIETHLKKYYQSPNVTVEISQIRSKIVYLLGEVAKKGPIDLTPGMTLLQAISSAGGLNDYANTKKIYILRNSSGKQEKILVRYKEALKGDSALNLPLQPGDTIVVP
jgi:polysaccharide export outer membrane protein